MPKLRMQVGSKMFPLKGEIGERESIGEFLYRLELSSGSWGSDHNTHGLSRAAYLDVDERAFISAIDVERILTTDSDIDFSGLSLRDSPTIVLQWRDLQAYDPVAKSIKTSGLADNEKPPMMCHVFLYSNTILSIGLDTVAVLE